MVGASAVTSISEFLHQLVDIVAARLDADDAVVGEADGASASSARTAGSCRPSSG
jgi:hypothetical protein